MGTGGELQQMTNISDLVIVWYSKYTQYNQFSCYKSILYHPPPFMTSPSVFCATSNASIHPIFLPHFLSLCQKQTRSILPMSLITSVLLCVMSGLPRSEVFIFSHSITKQLVLPDTERHFEHEHPFPGPCSVYTESKAAIPQTPSQSSLRQCCHGHSSHRDTNNMAKHALLNKTGKWLVP